MLFRLRYCVQRDDTYSKYVSDAFEYLNADRSGVTPSGVAVRPSTIQPSSSGELRHVIANISQVTTTEPSNKLNSTTAFSRSSSSKTTNGRHNSMTF